MSFATHFILGMRDGLWPRVYHITLKVEHRSKPEMSMKQLLDKNGILSSWMMIPNIYSFYWLVRLVISYHHQPTGLYIAATARLGGHSP